MKNEQEHHVHEFEPIYDSKSSILILGTFPSVKSRENNFYYGHPQNRFWKVLSSVLTVDLPKTIDDKKKMLIDNNIALWDVISSCDITGSSDSSIKNVVPSNIGKILENSRVKVIYANGKKAKSLYDRYLKKKLNIEIVALPSTSPANASYSLDRLIDEWKCVLSSIKR